MSWVAAPSRPESTSGGQDNYFAALGTTAVAIERQSTVSETPGLVGFNRKVKAVSTVSDETRSSGVM